jgi:hypothetical protein
MTRTCRCFFGRGMQHNNLHLEPMYSQDLGGKDIGRGIHLYKARGESLYHLWLSSLYPCSNREEDQDGALPQERFICRLH